MWWNVENEVASYCHKSQLLKYPIINNLLQWCYGTSLREGARGWEHKKNKEKDYPMVQWAWAAGSDRLTYILLFLRSPYWEQEMAHMLNHSAQSSLLTNCFKNPLWLNATQQEKKFYTCRQNTGLLYVNSRSDSPTNVLISHTLHTH